jgi:hypothetical protein
MRINPQRCGSMALAGDSYLIASEIAAMILDADWVILTTWLECRGRRRAGNRSLLGLARAFFYAGYIGAKPLPRSIPIQRSVALRAPRRSVLSRITAGIEISAIERDLRRDRPDQVGVDPGSGSMIFLPPASATLRYPSAATVG